MPKVNKRPTAWHNQSITAAIERLGWRSQDTTEQYTKPLPDSAVQQVTEELFGGELTEEEGDRQIPKKKRRWRGTRKMTSNGGSRLVQKLAEKMALNEVTIPFNFLRASKHQAQLGQTALKPMTWDDDTPRRLWSEDGYIMVASMPKLTSKLGTIEITNSILEYATYVTPHMRKSATSAESVGQYVERPGEVSGEIRLVKGWFGIGQEHKGEVVPSPETFRTGGAFARTAELYRKLNFLSKMINETIELVDPRFFQGLRQLHERATGKHASLAAWTSVDPLLFEGREVLLNRLSGRHRDKQDPKLSYAGLYVAGNFTSGGYLYLHQLNLRVRLLPGDFVLIRGRVLEHEVGAWDGGQRISIPHFTHTSLWRDCGLEDLVDL